MGRGPRFRLFTPVETHVTRFVEAVRETEDWVFKILDSKHGEKWALEIAVTLLGHKEDQNEKNDDLVAAIQYVSHILSLPMRVALTKTA
jgi:hypothetical protein